MTNPTLFACASCGKRVRPGVSVIFENGRMIHVACATRPTRRKTKARRDAPGRSKPRPTEA